MDEKEKMHVELTIELTNKCLNNCIHCSSDAGERCARFLPLDRIYDVIDEIKPEKIILSGGEPLLYPFLNELLPNIANKGKLVLDSCGNIPRGILENLDDKIKLFSEVYLSIFFLDDGNELITRNNISFSLIFLIWYLRNRANVWINTPVFNENQIIDIPSLCFNFGVPVHILKLLNRGRARNIPILPLEKQRRIAIAIVDQLDPVRARQRPPSFLCHHVAEVLPEDIEILSSIHDRCKISHSLMQSECRAMQKRTLLVNGTLIGCVAGKGITNEFDSRRICDL